MATPEGRVVASVSRQLKALGFWHINVFGDMHGRQGKPDIVTCVDGRLVAIEVKRAGTSPRIMQCVHALEILESGGRFLVAYEDFDIDAVIDGAVQKLEVDGDIDEEQLHETCKKRTRDTYEIVFA